MRRLVIAAATAFLMLGVATPAVAAAPTPLETAKRLTTARIDGRLATLAREGIAVRNAARLSDAHQSTLEGILDYSVKGLTALRAKVQTETTVEAVRLDAVSMVNDYRVYLLVTPQVRITIAADIAAATIRTLDDAAQTLAAAIETAEQAGKDMTAAKAKLDEMRRHISAAQSGLDGVADGLLAVKPGPDAEAIKNAVSDARGKVRAARAEIRLAAAAARACRDLIR